MKHLKGFARKTTDYFYSLYFHIRLKKHFGLKALLNIYKFAKNLCNKIIKCLKNVFLKEKCEKSLILPKIFAFYR